MEILQLSFKVGQRGSVSHAQLTHKSKWPPSHVGGSSNSFSSEALLPQHVQCARGRFRKRPI